MTATTAVHDLLAAVRDAMELPPPADPAHLPVQDRIRAKRAEYVCEALGQAAPDDAYGLDATVRALRLAPALFPVNYRPAGGSS
ncbi:hypothetical protein [Nocardiopsis chromatogenes]|uniref:hypothetical protein n=1 Tax=Nocardiopsis chromatogenes TaxID=280239 RepID=UPI00034A8AA5|nr:hypothetical protein [Nocardiopsis chromatogenes]